MNLLSWLLLALLAAWFIAAVARRKKGGCGGNCAECARRGGCAQKPPRDR